MQLQVHDTILSFNPNPNRNLVANQHRYVNHVSSGLRVNICSCVSYNKRAVSVLRSYNLTRQ